MKDLQGRTAFITGGASGIGLGIAKACVNAGMNVVVSDIREDHLESALAGFAGQGQRGRVHGLRLDVTDRDAFSKAADECERVFGKVHVLVNNAGMGLIGPAKLAGYSDWDWGVKVMIGGVINGIHTFLPRMIQHGEGGHIVSTASMAAIVPIPNASIYCMTKSAVVGLSESLRGELAPEGIGVSAFCPGPVQTNIREAAKLRPAEFQENSGFAVLERQLEDRPNSPLWMTIEECGERVLNGVKNNDLYIFTHREFKEGAAERCQAIVDAFPDEPVQQERADAIRFLLSNPIYRRAQAEG